MISKLVSPCLKEKREGLALGESASRDRLWPLPTLGIWQAW